jgi:hypothetical protein
MRARRLCKEWVLCSLEDLPQVRKCFYSPQGSYRFLYSFSVLPPLAAEATDSCSKPLNYHSERIPMTGNNLPQLTGAKRSLLFLLASSALFTTGCSNMLSTGP